jgi:uncharacterized protein YybS (DUF2232 family)
LFLWAAGALGPAGALINLTVPLPAAYIHMRRGPLMGCGVVILAAAVLLAAGDQAGVLAYLLQFGLASMVLPFLLRRNWPWDRAVAGTLVVLLAVGGITLTAYSSARGLPVTELVGQYLDSEVESALAIYQQANLPEDQLEELQATIRQMAVFLLRAWPALMTVATAGVLLINVLMLSALSRGRYEMPGGHFRSWKAPELLVWPLILAGFGLMYAQGLSERVSVNVLTLLLPLYFMQGLAVVTHYFQKRGIPPFFRGLGYLLLTVLNPLPLMVVAVGVFDLWADFRNPKIKNKQS